MFTGIYKIESQVKPERFYIGSAVNIEKRINEHLYGLKNNKHHSKKLQFHFNKYGESDLIFLVLIHCEKQNLISNEQIFIDLYHPYFNVCKIAGSCLGIKHSEESKRKISYPRSEEVKQKMRNNHVNFSGKNNPMYGKLGINNPNFGKKSTIETKIKCSKAKTGILMSKEAKIKLSNYHKRKPLLTCIYCGKQTRIKTNIIRWHNENCKLKTIK